MIIIGEVSELSEKEIIKKLQSASIDEKCLLIWEMGNRSESWRIPPKVLRELVRILQHSPSEEVRAITAWCLGQFGYDFVIPHLIAVALLDESRLVKSEALRAIMNMNSIDTFVNFFEKIAKYDPYSDVRIVAQEAILKYHLK